MDDIYFEFLYVCIIIIIDFKLNFLQENHSQKMYLFY